jgi:transposase
LSLQHTDRQHHRARPPA